jgi:replicative DNA helicase
LNQPCSEQLEKAVLGSLLLFPELIAQHVDNLGAERFHFTKHKHLLRAMLDLHNSRAPIELATLQVALERRGQWEECGKTAYLAELDLSLPDVSRLDSYLDGLQELHIRRELVLGAQRIGHQASVGEEGTKDLLASARAWIDGLEQETGNKLAKAGEGLEEFLDDPAAYAGIPSGYPGIDSKLICGGFGRGHQVQICGRTSMGKTALAVDLALVAGMAGANVAVFSLEMSKREVEMRMLPRLSLVPHERLWSGRMIEEDKVAACEGAAKLRGLDIHIDDRNGLTVRQISAAASSLAARRSLDLILIDHATRCGWEKEWKSETQAYAQIARQCKGLAKDLDCAVLSLVQLNRESERRTDPRPKLSDMYGGGWEPEADLVLSPFRPGYYDRALDPRITQLICLKQRNGPLFEVDLEFNPNYMAFREARRAPEVS